MQYSLIVKYIETTSLWNAQLCHVYILKHTAIVYIALNHCLLMFNIHTKP